ncbi:MAG: hypothetical protein WC254_04045 [Candidatus Woesearchaeota archaeon]|jgi:hypothetical protein
MRILTPNAAEYSYKNELVEILEAALQTRTTPLHLEWFQGLGTGDNAVGEVKFQFTVGRERDQYVSLCGYTIVNPSAQKPEEWRMRIKGTYVGFSEKIESVRDPDSCFRNSTLNRALIKHSKVLYATGTSLDTISQAVHSVPTHHRNEYTPAIQVLIAKLLILKFGSVPCEYHSGEFHNPLHPSLRYGFSAVCNRRKLVVSCRGYSNGTVEDEKDVRIYSRDIDSENIHSYLLVVNSLTSVIQRELHATAIDPRQLSEALKVHRYGL